MGLKLFEGVNIFVATSGQHARIILLLSLTKPRVFLYFHSFLFLFGLSICS
jgi:hypothetical protein